MHEPEVFDGARARYRSWKNQVQRYLTAFPDSSDHEKITMVISYIRGEQVNTWVDGFKSCSTLNVLRRVVLPRPFCNMNG